LLRSGLHSVLDDATRPRSRGDGETGSCAASSGLPVPNVGFVAIRDRPGIGGRRFILRSPTTRNDPAPLPSGGFGMASGVVTPAPALRPAQQQLLQRGLRCCGMQQKHAVSRGFSDAQFPRGRRDQVNRGSRTTENPLAPSHPRFTALRARLGAKGSGGHAVLIWIPRTPSPRSRARPS
jgi:hypothetical protein